MKVLYLSEWYPHRYDAMAGLFVQKHAMAVAGEGVDVCVLYFHHDTQIQKAEITDVTRDGIREIIVYYPKNYMSALRQGWRYVRERWGRPDICQLNVITKNALLPLWLKWRRGTPYIIVEHWTGYLDVFPMFPNSPLRHRLFARIAAREASYILAVSEDLKESMKHCGLKNGHWGIINNVVDDFFYDRPTIARTGKKNLLHISCFDEPHKNVCGLLRAARQVAEKRSDFMLTIVGVGPDFEQVHSYSKALDFPAAMLRWTGELPPERVAEEFDQADAFVLFSNYETAGIVLSESAVCGKPIISTPVGIAPLIVNEQTGISVPVGDEQALAEAIETMLDTCRNYDSQVIRSYGEAYRFETVGKHLYNIYSEVLCHTS